MERSVLNRFRWPVAAAISMLIVVVAPVALAQPAGRPDYRTMFDPGGSWGFLDPRLMM